MGKIEKLVVLAVLFVSAIVIAVSVHGSGEGNDPSQPFGTSEVAAKGGDDKPENPRPNATESSDSGSSHAYIEDETWDDETRREPALTEREGATEGDLYLSASESKPAESDAARATKRALRDAQGRPLILKSDADVEPSSFSEYVIYTPVEGDSWVSVAKSMFVGGTKHLELLRNQNEGMNTIEPGVPLMIPVYDLARSSRDPHRAREVRTVDRGNRSARTLERNDKNDTAETRTQPVKNAGLVVDGWYTVQDGDTLSGISKKVYGKATKWREIYAANKTRMSGPDWVDVGVRLRIPKLDETPTTTPKKASKVE